MTARAACEQLGIDSKAFYRLVQQERIRVQRRSARGFDYDPEDVAALVDDDEVLAMRDRALHYGDDEPIAPRVASAPSASILTAEVGQASSAFIEAVAQACAHHGLARTDAREPMEQLLDALWEASESVTRALPSADSGSRSKTGAGPNNKKKTRQRARREAAERASRTAVDSNTSGSLGYLMQSA